MTNRTAIFLAIAIIALVAIDQVALDGAVAVFLGRKLLELTEYIAFWR